MTDFYTFTNDDGIDVKTEVDLHLFEEAPQRERPWLMWVFVKFRSPTPQGWCGEEEAESINAMRNDLVAELEKSIDGCYAGTRANDGWMEIYFYAPSAKGFEPSAASVMKEHAIYAYEAGSARDAKWEHYLNELYPEPFYMLQMQSRHTIEVLLDEGDDLCKEREVEHYFFFQTTSSRERFTEAMTTFECKELIEEEQSDYAYGVTLAKSHALDEKTLDDISYELFGAAMKEHGSYEGWSTVLAT